MRISGRIKDNELLRHFVREENALEKIVGQGSVGRVYGTKPLIGYRPLVAKMVPFGHNQPYDNEPITSLADLHYMPREYFIINGKEQNREWEDDIDILLSTTNVCKEVLIGKILHQKTHAPFGRHFADYPVLCTDPDTGEDKLYFMIMQNDAPGHNVEKIIENSELPGPEIGRILYDVSRGIGILKEEGIVHRDLKPGNVHYMPASYLIDNLGRPLYFPAETSILDFSIATMVEDEIYQPRKNSRERFITLAQEIERQSGYAPGTPCYMSPEQIRGDPLDSNSDLYALGAVAFELLIGLSIHEFDENDNDDVQVQKLTRKLAFHPDKIQDYANEMLYECDRTIWVPAIDQLLSPAAKIRPYGQEKLNELALQMMGRQAALHRDLLC